MRGRVRRRFVIGERVRHDTLGVCNVVQSEWTDASRRAVAEIVTSAGPRVVLASKLHHGKTEWKDED